MAGFVSMLDEINLLAEQSPGFIWRLQGDGGDATSINAFEDPRVLVNMSVWQDQQSLSYYVYRSAHAGVMSRRKQWFEQMREAYHVLWWIEAGCLPTIDDAKVRLSSLRGAGPSAVAFNFKTSFAQPAAV